MLRIPGMPLLPGTCFRDVTQTKFPKSQSFMTKAGIAMLSDRQPPALVNSQGMIVDPNCPPPELPSIYPPKIGPKLPPWLAYDKQVLCFQAYFKETLQEVYHAPYQVRKVKILYYLDDGTMQVIEPKVENSGIPQGCLVHRQRIPKPAPCQNDFISILDLNVNITIEIFDRVYHITGCDLFTRHFLNRAGIHVPDPVESPMDPITEFRKKSAVKICTPSARNKHGFAQFLKFDRKVLKFSGYWNDNSEFGDIRNLEICYFLSDDTVEIKEIFPPNAGREGPSTFLKRGKLPKNWQGLPLPGEATDMTVLNVLGGGLRDGRFIEDVLGTGKKEHAYYTDCDLQIGTHLNVYGRDVVLVDCDDFTKEFYRKKYGIEDFPSIRTPKSAYDYAQEKKERVLPPYNGWGTYEDSEGNCISVEPKPPQPDFKKFVQYDKFILRFGAKMLSMVKENCERRFIISYYLSDDTIQIFEVTERNSGFLGGEFLKRTKITLPNQAKYTSSRPKYYQPYHFFIGSTLNLKDHTFVIVSADEYTLIYMENHPFEFPLADVKTIMTKIRESLRRQNYKDFIAKYLPAATGDSECKYVSYETLKRALIELLGDSITDHEIISICRFYSAEKAPPSTCNRDTVRSAAHLEIKRNLWNNFEQVREHIYHLNPTNRGYLPEEKVRSTIRGCRLPFPSELVDDIMMVVNRNAAGEIELCNFFDFIDVNCNPAPDIPPMNIAFELCPKIPFLHKGRLVDWNCFVKHLGLEDDLKKEAD